MVHWGEYWALLNKQMANWNAGDYLDYFTQKALIDPVDNSLGVLIQLSYKLGYIYGLLKSIPIYTLFYGNVCK